MRRGVPIMMYHSLCEPGARGFRRMALPPGLLDAHLAYLNQQGYRTLTVGELAARLRRDPSPSDRLVALTFDDVCADFIAVTLPKLLKRGMTATLFVPTGYVSAYSGLPGTGTDGSQAVLSWRELATIAGWGIEIGAHGHTHAELGKLADRELAEQVRLPKLLLEQHVGVPVQSFAYPYGLYSRRSRAAVAAAGYRAACTMGGWAATARSHPLRLPRVPAFDAADADTLALLMAASRSTVRRVARRARRAAAAIAVAADQAGGT